MRHHAGGKSGSPSESKEPGDLWQTGMCRSSELSMRLLDALCQAAVKAFLLLHSCPAGGRG